MFDNIPERFDPNVFPLAWRVANVVLVVLALGAIVFAAGFSHGAA